MMLLFISIYFKLFSSLYAVDSPKVINKYEGFRTKKSMANQKNWNRAQILMTQGFQKFTKLFVRAGLIFAVLEIGSFFIKTIDVLAPLLVAETIIMLATCAYLHYSIDKNL